MKTRIIITVGILGVIFSIVLLWTVGSLRAQEISEYREIPDQNFCEQMDGKWNADHCIMTQETFDSNNLTCDPGPISKNGICSSNGITLVVQSKMTLYGDVDDFDKTWGGLGNRHPAFLGWDIPDICTQDMVKFLKKNSDMFEKDVPYGSPLDGDVTGLGINPDDMVQCENELLDKRDNEPSWPGK